MSGETGGRGAGESGFPLRDCPFCEYAGPSEVLWDYGDCIVFEPLNPVVPGHVLVAPKAHAGHFTEDLEVTAAVARRAAQWAREVGDCNLITSKGLAATQTVEHLHLHVIPRRADDGLALPWPSTQPSPESGSPLLDLLEAVEPFTVDGGISCGREEDDKLVETYERIIGGLPSQSESSSGDEGEAIPRDYWREVPCGHPPDPVAMYGRDGNPVCHCGCTLDPAKGQGLPQPPEAPGPIVNCPGCGCYVAIPPKSTPTQPLQGSEVERRWKGKRFLVAIHQGDRDDEGTDQMLLPDLAQLPPGWEAIELAVIGDLRDLQAQLQQAVEGRRRAEHQREEIVDEKRSFGAQLQRVEEQRDKAREQTEAMAWAAGWETDGCPPFEFEAVRKQIIESGHEDSRDYADALVRATQAEARIQEAAQEFRRWGHIEELRVADARSGKEAEGHRLAALGVKRCAEYLRSQSSSEVGEGRNEELTMIALALKNHGIEGVTPERGVELLIEEAYRCSSPSRARELRELLKAVEPFTVDGGISCGREELDALVETYERIAGGSNHG